MGMDQIARSDPVTVHFLGQAVFSCMAGKHPSQWALILTDASAGAAESNL